MNYRLPTEAEWEFAALGGNRSKGYKYAGGDNIDSVGWHQDNSGSKTHPVGKKVANEVGLYDMSGNVWEWCNDWFNKDYYSNSPHSNPMGPSSGVERVLRGNSWLNDSIESWLVGRGHCDPSDHRNGIGFRVAMDP